jgi:hypothetical protein
VEPWTAVGRNTGWNTGGLLLIDVLDTIVLFVPSGAFVVG